jgi:hypothetical protein
MVAHHPCAASVRRMMRSFIFLPVFVAISAVAVCAAQSTLPPVPAPLGVPAPGPSNDAPYAPQPILPGGVIMTLYPSGSPFLNMEKVRQAEQYNMSQAVSGRINSIVNIHNPSIEVHTVDRGLNTGAAVILVPGGRPQHSECWFRGRGFRSLFLQLRRQYHHPAQPPAARRIRSPDR